jgi:hypothetical protein
MMSSARFREEADAAIAIQELAWMIERWASLRQRYRQSLGDTGNPDTPTLDIDR